MLGLQANALRLVGTEKIMECINVMMETKKVEMAALACVLLRRTIHARVDILIQKIDVPTYQHILPESQSTHIMTFLLNSVDQFTSIMVRCQTLICK